ncbi:hypothetical protein [Providencia burhodogranariea]|uniref:Uncharacterized protein n=1 Tax=Providencia burhodogranariea DSM 19968 TaxID=1141662 RepID=K8WN54_9GAMM|nr:hypothetical protein [Providencia burhodogranariea]EKT61994.1 hypothetical protein OOA_08886 [Providencia burhodogranariea DSM 19968]
MPYVIRIDTKVIILNDKITPDAVSQQELIVYITDKDTGQPVETGMTVVFTPDKYVKLSNENNTTNDVGMCSATVELNYDLIQPWASETFVDISLENPEDAESKRAKVYYGTLDVVDFLNIKGDESTGYYYDKYEQEKETLVKINNVPISGNGLELHFFFDEGRHRVPLDAGTLPLVIDLRREFDEAVFTDGQHDLYYTIVDDARNITTSKNFRFRLDYGTSTRILPMIEIPNLVNGYINQRYWLDGVQYDFNKIFVWLMDYFEVSTLDEVLGYIDSQRNDAITLRFKGTDTKGNKIDYNDDNIATETFSLERFKTDVVAETVLSGAYIFQDKVGTASPDRYSLIEEGTLEVDVSIKTINVDRPLLSKIKRVLVDILPPAKLDD